MKTPSYEELWKEQIIIAGNKDAMRIGKHMMDWSKTYHDKIIKDNDASISKLQRMVDHLLEDYYQEWCSDEIFKKFRNELDDMDASKDSSTSDKNLTDSEDRDNPISS